MCQFKKSYERFVWVRERALQMNTNFNTLNKQASKWIRNIVKKQRQSKDQKRRIKAKGKAKNQKKGTTKEEK